MKSAAVLIFILIFAQVSLARFEVPTEVAPQERVEVKQVVAETSKVKSLWNRFKAKVKEYIPEQTATVAVKPSKSVADNPVRVPATAPKLIDKKVEADWKISVEKIKEIKVARPLSPAVITKDTNLTTGASKVPVFDFKKIKKAAIKVQRVPLLFLGDEEVLDPNGFEVIAVAPFPAIAFEKTEFQTPAMWTVEQFKRELGPELPVVAAAEKIPIPILTAEKRVTAEKINQIVFVPLKETAWTDLAVVKFSDEDLKLLRALILYDKKDLCHIAAGIFAGLVNSQNPKVKQSSEFHLGTCLHVMNLPTEAQFYLNRVIKSKDPLFTSDAIKTSLAKIKRHQEDEFAEVMMGLEENLIPKESLNDVNYLKAKYYAKRHKNEDTIRFAEKVTRNSNKYFKALYLTIPAYHFTGKTDTALLAAKKLADELKSDGSDKELLALAQIQVGRISFQKGKYKESMESFQKVTKDNSLWIQALTEQGWAQLQSKDAAGAIGNMHSIQSPFFDSVYKPESYVVRSIGYLTMCQYADAYKTLVYLEKKYYPWLEQLGAFNKSHDATAMYDAILKSIQAQNKVAIDGVPPQMLKEVARQRDFLNAQESINSLIDEASGYPFIVGIVEKDKRALTTRKTQSGIKIADLQLKIRQAEASKVPQVKKTAGSLKAELYQIQDFLTVYEFKMATYREGEEGFKKLTPAALDRVGKVKNAAKVTASTSVKNHFQKMARMLRSNFDNNELLKYEIFAGSGENLRYQVAGGKVVGMPKALERKLAAQNWDFDGEFWEDEIGHYRSALKNNCKRD